jgi:hypothetical protein
MKQLYEMLGIGEECALMITALRLEAWGRDVVFVCRCGDVRFEMMFADCREMRWRTYVHGDSAAEVQVADLVLGRDGHRSPAQLLTDAFGVSLFYGELRVKKL